MERLLQTKFPVAYFHFIPLVMYVEVAPRGAGTCDFVLKPTCWCNASEIGLLIGLLRILLRNRSSCYGFPNWFDPCLHATRDKLVEFYIQAFI